MGEKIIKPSRKAAGAGRKYSVTRVSPSNFTKPASVLTVFLLLLCTAASAYGQGAIVGWGSMAILRDSELQNLVAVAAGCYHSLGLKADGSIVAWGSNWLGQCNVPSPNTGFVAVAAGDWHSLGLKADGSIVAWGRNSNGQCNVPSPNTGFVAVAAGAYHGLGLKADGSIVAWGYNYAGQCNVPSPNTGFVAVAAGAYHSLGLKADGGTSPVVSCAAASQRADGSKIVDIYYNLDGPPSAKYSVSIKLSSDGGTTYPITPTSVAGDIGPDVTAGTGKHIIWDAGRDLPGEYGTNYKIAVTAGGTAYSNIFTIDNREPPSSGNIRITSVRSTYNGVFPQGVDVINAIRASLDWAGKAPGKVVFELNGEQTEVIPDGSEAEITYNMGTDLQYSRAGFRNDLVVFAVAADGTMSEPYIISFFGLELPEWAVSRDSKKGPINFEIDPLIGRLRFSGEVEVLRGGIKGTIEIPESIPEIGGRWGVNINPLDFTWALAAQPRFGDRTGITGTFELGGEWSAEASCGTRRKGTLSASLSGAGQFHPEFKLTDVSAQLAGGFTFLLPRVPLLCPLTGCCHSGCWPYFQASIRPEVAGTVGMEEGEPDLIAGLRFKNALLNLSCTVAGTIGAGSEGSIYYIAGTVGGKPYITLQFPGNPLSPCLNEYIREVGFDLQARATHECAWWKWEVNWTFNIFRCPETGQTYVTATPSGEKEIVHIGREYLKAPEGYCVFPPVRTMGIQSVGGLPDPIMNVGSGPWPSIAADDDSGLLLFVYDDASKPTSKHQEIHYATWTGSQWSSHASITNNLKPDLYPAAAIDSAGKKIAVWVSGSEPTGTETGPRDVIPGFEIVYSTYNEATQTWNAPQTLTTNSYVDILPWFERSASGNLRLCWISSPTNAIPVWHDEQVIPSIDLMASDWNGDTFGNPYLLAGGLQAVSPPSVYKDSSREYLAYVKDTDLDSATADDREVVVRSRDVGGNWSNDICLTTDNVTDSAAQVTADATGTPIVVWVKQMVTKTLPDGSETSEDQLWFARWNGSNWDEPQRAFSFDGITELKLVRNQAGKLVAFFIGASPQFTDIYYTVYEPSTAKWGTPQQLTQDQGAETMASFAESGGDILAAYVKRRIDLGSPTGLPEIGLSDLFLAKHSPERDLFVAANDISFDPSPPIRGQTANITAIIHLAGDFSASNVGVEFYDGDPLNQGTIIGSGTIASILPGETASISVPWTVPNDCLKHEIYVMVDPNNSIPETDETQNNITHVDVFAPDLTITPPVLFSCPSADTVLIGFTVRNSGSSNAPPSTCELRLGGQTGSIVYSGAVPELGPNASASIQFSLDVSSIPAGTYELFANCDSSCVVAESNETNNFSTATIPVLPDFQIAQETLQASAEGVSLRIRNIGCKAGQATVVRANCGDAVLAETSIQPLAPGASVDVTLTFSGSQAYDTAEVTVNPDSNGTDEVTLLNNSVRVYVSNVRSIGRARRLRDGTRVSLSGKIVTAVFDDCVYVEEEDRSAGIRVNQNELLQIGNRVAIDGQVTTISGEKALVGRATVLEQSAQVPKPLGMTGYSIVGSLNRSKGLDSSGLLVHVWGRVTVVGSDYIYIDDGSACEDGTLTNGLPNIGVRIMCDPGLCNCGDVIAAKGIASCFKTATGGYARCIRTREPGDITILEPAQMSNISRDDKVLRTLAGGNINFWDRVGCCILHNFAWFQEQDPSS